MIVTITNNEQRGKWEQNSDTNESIPIFCLTKKAVITKPVCDCNYE